MHRTHITPAAAPTATTAAFNASPSRRWCSKFSLAPPLRNASFCFFSRGGGGGGGGNRGGAGVHACGPLKEGKEGDQLTLGEAHVLPCDVRRELNGSVIIARSRDAQGNKKGSVEQ